MANLQDKGRGRPINKQALYSAASAYALDAIDVLVREMKEGDNSAARVGAVRVLLDKCLPSLKSSEFTDGEGKSLIEKIIIVKAGDGSTSSPESVAG